MDLRSILSVRAEFSVQAPRKQTASLFFPTSILANLPSTRRYTDGTVKSCISILTALALSAAAFGASPLPDAAPVSLDALIAQLGSSDFASREAAHARLEARTDLTLADVQARLSDPGLNAEAKTRLLAVAKEIFMRTPRAAIGVRFGGGFGAPAGSRPNTVQDVIAGFPALGVLQPGDAIVAIDGVSVGQDFGMGTGMSSSVRPQIVSRDPGDVVDMQVWRNGELLDLRVPLGKFADLRGGPNSLSPDDYEQAWRVRRAAMQAAARGGPSQQTPAGFEQIRASMSMINDGLAAARSMGWRSSQSMTRGDVLAGGQPGMGNAGLRSGMVDQQGSRVWSDNGGGQRLAGGRVAIQIGPGGQVVGGQRLDGRVAGGQVLIEPRLQNINPVVDPLTLQLEALRMQERMFVDMLRDADLPPEVAKAIQQNLDAARREAHELELQIRRRQQP